MYDDDDDDDDDRYQPLVSLRWQTCDEKWTGQIYAGVLRPLRFSHGCYDDNKEYHHDNDSDSVACSFRAKNRPTVPPIFKDRWVRCYTAEDN